MVSTYNGISFKLGFVLVSYRLCNFEGKVVTLFGALKSTHEDVPLLSLPNPDKIWPTVHKIHIREVQFSSGQSPSHVRLFGTPWTAAHQASLSITNSHSLLKLMSIESVKPSNHLILCHLLLPPSVFPNESALRIRWPKYWSFSFSISPSNEYLGLISFRMDWLDLLAVQGTQESSPTPQFKSINSLALSCLSSPTLASIHDYRKNHTFD